MTLLTGTCCFGGVIILFLPNTTESRDARPSNVDER
jgi:hypothetical protein